METVAEIMAFNAVINFFSFAFSVAMYVLSALGLYTIAKRRGINNPWLAWIPVGNAWILGSISDQYQFSIKRKKTGRRKVLLGLEIGMMAAAVLMVIVMVVMIFSLAMQTGFEEEYYYNSASYYGPMEESQAVASVLGIVLTVLAMTLVIMVVSVVYMVFAYMSYYDLYMSCNPSNATVFLVLSIFFSFLSSIFVFVCRNKDEGMRPQMSWQYPPQGYQPPYGQAGYQPPQPYPPAQPYYPQPPQPPVHPMQPEQTTIEPEQPVQEDNI